MPSPSQFSHTPSVAGVSQFSGGGKNPIAQAASLGRVYSAAGNARTPQFDDSVGRAIRSVGQGIKSIAEFEQFKASKEYETNYKLARSEIDSALQVHNINQADALKRELADRTRVWKDGETPIMDSMDGFLQSDSVRSNPSFQALSEIDQKALLSEIVTLRSPGVAQTESNLRSAAEVNARIHKTERMTNLALSKDLEYGKPDVIQAVANEIVADFPTDEDYVRTTLTQFFDDVVAKNLNPSKLPIEDLDKAQVDPENHVFMKMFDQIANSFQDKDGNSLVSHEHIQQKRASLSRFLSGNKNEPSPAARQKAVELRVARDRAAETRGSLAPEGALDPGVRNANRSWIALTEEYKSLAGTGAVNWTASDESALQEAKLQEVATNIVQDTLASRHDRYPELMDSNGDVPISEALSALASEARAELDQEGLAPNDMALRSKVYQIAQGTTSKGAGQMISRLIQNDSARKAFLSTPSLKTATNMALEAAKLGVPFTPVDPQTRQAMLGLVVEAWRNPGTMEGVDQRGLDALTEGLFTTAKTHQEKVAILLGVDIGGVDKAPPIEEKALTNSYTALGYRLIPNTEANGSVRETLSAVEAQVFGEAMTTDQAFRDRVEGLKNIKDPKDLREAENYVKKTLYNKVLNRIDRREVRVDGRLEYVKASETEGVNQEYLESTLNQAGNLSAVLFIPSDVTAAFQEGRHYKVDPDFALKRLEESTWPGQAKNLQNTLIKRIKSEINSYAGWPDSPTKTKVVGENVRDVFEAFVEDMQKETEVVTDRYGRIVLRTSPEGGSYLGTTSRGMSLEALQHVIPDRLNEIISRDYYQKTESPLPDIFGQTNFQALGPEISPLKDSDLIESLNQTGLGLHKSIQETFKDESIWEKGEQIGGAAVRVEVGPYVGLRMEGPLATSVASTSGEARLHQSSSSIGKDAGHLITRSFASLFDGIGAQNLDHEGNLMPMGSSFNRNLQEGLEAPIRNKLREIARNRKEAGDTTPLTFRMTVLSATQETADYDNSKIFGASKPGRKRTVAGLSVKAEILDTNGTPIPDGVWAYDVSDETVRALYEKTGL